MQGSQVHVIGAAGGEAWGKELPGLASTSRGGEAGSKGEGEMGVGTEVDRERMKIAWRYEGLGREKKRGAWRNFCKYTDHRQFLFSPELAPALHSRFLDARYPICSTTADICRPD